MTQITRIVAIPLNDLMQRAFTFALGLFGLLFTTASACPLCHTTTADEVRAGIRTTAEDGTVVVAIFSPFLALGIIVGILNRFSAGGYSVNSAHIDQEIQ
jgi:hypothetical protein